uniref:PUM-HD domain-containing protein n=1 Tax=Globodera rostochiensis TaxID=31243 RepID=A0A914IGZ5_GLORO
MINRFIRNFLNGQHIICKVQQIQTVRVVFLHHCNKNVCPAAVLSCGACMASSSSSSNRPSNRSKLLDAYRNKRAANLQLTDLGKDAVAFAQDPLGSRFIEQKLERANPTEKAQPQINMATTLQENVPTLVTDKYGTFVIEHVIEHGLPEDRERIVRSLQGDIMKYSQDKFGCLVILKCFVCGTADQKKALFDNVCVGGPKTLQNARQLMADEFGTHVIRKFFECGTDDQKAQLVDALRGHVLELALQIYGGPVIQTALKSVDKASQIEIIEELTPRSCVIRCIKDQYGSHVMDTIFELVEPERLQFVVDAILSSPSDSVASLSLHECGYRVIQRMLEHCTEQQKRPVLEQLLDNVPTLVTDQYGSFVIERVIEHGLPEDRERIVRTLQGDILKTHYKSICSIIEKCLIFGTTEQKNALIDQLCADDGTGKTPLLQMMKQQFANDVVVRMVDGADSAHRDKMMFAIEEHIPALLKRQQLLAKRAGGAVVDKRKKPNNG